MFATGGDCYISINNFTKTRSGPALFEKCLEITSVAGRHCTNKNGPNLDTWRSIHSLSLQDLDTGLAILILQWTTSERLNLTKSGSHLIVRPLK